MSKIIGTCLGEYVRDEDVLYDPQSDVYKIKAGDRIMEIPGYALKSESVRTLKETLSNVDDENIKIDMLGTWAKARSEPMDYNGDEAYRKTYLGDWGPEAKTSAATGPAGATFGSQSFDPLRARVEAAGSYAAQDVALTIASQKLRASSSYGSSLGKAQAHASAPWDDPLAADLTAARNTVACMDMPEWKPDYNPNEQVKVYYHDRYPSIPVRSIIDDAIELLNTKKNLHISKISFSQSHPDFRLSISSDIPNRPESRRILEVLINHAAFDRAYKTDLDKYAKLKAKLDTNTYMKLRIAFLLYEALKLSDRDAERISLDIFKIIGSSTRPNFHI